MNILTTIEIRRRSKSRTRNYILFVLLFSFSVSLFAQNPSADSTKSPEDTIILSTSLENDLNLPIESFKLFTDPYQLRNYDFQFSTNFDFAKTLYPGSLNQDMLYVVELNRQDFLKQMTLNFRQSQPTTLQSILGMVQTGAVAAMAGYHVYKYYVKEKKKL